MSVQTATGSNRTNSSGRSLGNIVNRTSLTIRNIVQAGGILPIPAAGTQFYVSFASAPIEIRPSDGTFVAYSQGTGLQLTEVNSFSLLEIRNQTANPITFELFVGFDQYIDNRLIITTSSLAQVVYPTYPVAGSATFIDIPDRANTAFDDINGNHWLGVSRVCILVGNPDASQLLYVQRGVPAPTLLTDPAILPVYPGTSSRLDVSGHYAMTVGGGSINAIVSEIYNAIPAT